jgi:hypothetical protein
LWPPPILAEGKILDVGLAVRTVAGSVRTRTRARYYPWPREHRAIDVDREAGIRPEFSPELCDVKPLIVGRRGDGVRLKTDLTILLLAMPRKQELGFLGFHASVLLSVALLCLLLGVLLGWFGSYQAKEELEDETRSFDRRIMKEPENRCSSRKG